ncbi:MAG: DUF3332 domain-containing protein [Muribaculaceae bacterium]|nr:DUF3332 domain-containing protein [Muribaculaceae bacterium]
MKKKIFRGAVAFVLALSLTVTPSCIGSFSLSNRLLGWNQTVGNKFVNELVFFAFWVLPVYEVCGLADILVLNSIEFWSGRNPMTASVDKVIEGSDGLRYRIHSDANGYDVACLDDETISYRLDYSAENDGWTIAVDDSEPVTLFNYVDETHVALPDGNGGMRTVELSQQGVFAYNEVVAARSFAAR